MRLMRPGANETRPVRAAKAWNRCWRSVTRLIDALAYALRTRAATYCIRLARKCATDGAMCKMASEPIYGAVEAGGTKFTCAVGRSVRDVLEEKRIATRQPAETLAEVLQFFHAMQIKHGRMR